MFDITVVTRNVMGQKDITTKRIQNCQCVNVAATQVAKSLSNAIASIKAQSRKLRVLVDCELEKVSLNKFLTG